jgi:dTDP-4-dehydrorhamnose 3,5-epimerase
VAFATSFHTRDFDTLVETDKEVGVAHALNPILIKGGLAVDDRGEVGFVNDFDFAGVRRFYTVKNHRSGFVRAWHGHRHEAKYVTVVEGAALVGAVKIEDWEKPASEAPVARYVLSARNPSVLHIPAGYANGFMSLTDDAMLIFYATATLAESQSDDIRYDARFWDIWKVEER